MKTKTRHKRKKVDGAEESTRNVPKQTICPRCKEKFWAPEGKCMCPWCGKHLIVIDGVSGSMYGYFSSLLEGFALSGEISAIEVKWVDSAKKKPSGRR